MILGYYVIIQICVSIVLICYKNQDWLFVNRSEIYIFGYFFCGSFDCFEVECRKSKCIGCVILVSCGKYLVYYWIRYIGVF